MYAPAFTVGVEVEGLTGVDTATVGWRAAVGTLLLSPSAVFTADIRDGHFEVLPALAGRVLSTTVGVIPAIF